MKQMKLFALVATMMGFAACNSDDPVVQGNEIPSDITFVSGDYYGDENKDGVAKYTVILSMGAAESAANVFHLTFFSKMVLDAEYALPEAGKYTVANGKELSAVLAGKSKIAEGNYDGSYVVSIANGTLRESKITGGSMDVSYANGKCEFRLNFTDEAGILATYADLRYNGKGSEAFTNKAVVYYNFRKPDQDYNRCWYWGEASSSIPATVDGVLLGEYMFVFSNVLSSEVAAEGQVSTVFSLMDEFQLYGLDRKIRPGVYPINQDFKIGKLGTIYLADLTDEYAKYSSTAMATVFEGGKAVSHFVTDGWLAIFGDSNDVPNRFVVDFTLDDGTKFQGRYDGVLPVGDEWTLSSFQEDVTQNELVGGYMRLKDPDYMYEEAGVNQWELYLMSEGVFTSVDEYGSVVIHGPGDCFRFAVSTDISVVDGLPVGTYEIKNSYEAGVAQQGNKYIGFIGIYVGAWFHRIVGGNTGTYSTMGLSGTLKISKAGEQYTIETTFSDDARNTISGRYVGIPMIVDHRTAEESVPMSDSFMKRNIEKALKKHSTASTPYQNRYKQRVERVGVQLK